MKAFLDRFQTDESGATAIEYGMIVALVAVVALTAFTAFGNAGNNLISGAMNAISGAITGVL